MRVYSFTSHLEECCQGRVLMPVNQYRKWDDACPAWFPLQLWTTAPCLSGWERHRSKPQQHPGGPHAVQRFILEVKHCKAFYYVTYVNVCVSPCGLRVRAPSERKSRSMRAVCAVLLQHRWRWKPHRRHHAAQWVCFDCFLPGSTQHVCLFSVIGIALKVSGHP